MEILLLRQTSMIFFSIFNVVEVEIVEIYILIPSTIKIYANYTLLSLYFQIHHPRKRAGARN